MSNRKRWNDLGIVRLIATLCFFTLVITGCAYARPEVVVTMPDTGLFSVWVTSAQGNLTLTPFTSHGHSAITVPVTREEGQKLYVLDGKTGRLAVLPINITPDGSAPPLALLVSDFNPIVTPGGDDVSLTSRPTVSPLGRESIPVSDQTASRSSSAGSSDEEWTTPLATFLIGLVLAGVGSWIVYKLARRSQPAYEYAPEPVPFREPRGPDGHERNAASERKGRPRYRVTKSADRAARKRARVHMPRLVGTDGLAAGSRFVLSTPIMSIGRDGDNEIVLAETKVSRRHARIESGASGYITLIDEASANGVYVNGMRVEKAVLRQGDEIKIGDSFFRFEE